MRSRAGAQPTAWIIAWLRNIGLVSHEERDQLSANEPRSGDYLSLGLPWRDELEAPYLSPSFIASCLKGYTSAALAESRVLELLRGTLSVDDLPAPESSSMDALRRSFEGHTGSGSDA